MPMTCVTEGSLQLLVVEPGHVVKVGIGDDLADVFGGELVRDALGLAGGDDVHRHRRIVAATELAASVVREGEETGVTVASSGFNDAAQDEDAAEAIVRREIAGGGIAHGGGGPHLDVCSAPVAAVLGVAFHLRADDAGVAATAVAAVAATAALSRLFAVLVSRRWARRKLFLAYGILCPLFAVLVLPLVVTPTEFSAAVILWAAISSQCAWRLRSNRPEGGQDCQCR